jgi:hypothetical protein
MLILFRKSKIKEAIVEMLILHRKSKIKEEIVGNVNFSQKKSSERSNCR